MRHLDRLIRAVAVTAILLGAAERAHGQQVLTLAQTAHPLMFYMESSASPGTGVTGLSPTVTLSKDGGSFASPSGAVTEIANGWYKVAGNATDEGTDGTLILHATGTGAYNAEVRFIVRDTNIYDAVRGGLTALPNANAEAAGGLYTRGTGAGQINQDGNGRIDVNTVRIDGAAYGTHASGMAPADVRDLLGTAWLTPGTAGTPDVNVKLINAVSTSSVTTIKAVQGLTTADTIATYTGNTPQTGDAFALIGTAGAGLTALGDTRIANLNATVSSRMATFSLPTNFNALVIDLNGRVDVSKVGGTSQTARDLGASVLLSSGSGTGQVLLTSGKIDRVALVDTTTTVTNDVGITQAGADKVWSTATRALTDKAGFSLSAGGVQAVWDALTSALTTVGSIGKRLSDDVDATVSSRLATSGYTAPDNADVATILARTDVATSTRLAAADYAAPDSAATIAAAVWATVIDTSLTAKKYLALIGATTTGKTTGAGTATMHFFGDDDATVRLDSAIDQSSGERTSVTRHAP